MALLRGSDAHPTVKYEPRSTWIYLPEVSTECLRHAFATHESSISHELSPPPGPSFWIRSIQLEGGPFHGRRIEFSPRANAIIGPPSSGKSLVVDAIRLIFNLPCTIDDVRSSIEKRLERCLPNGTNIVVELATSSGERELRLVQGGTTRPEVDEQPIVFSQAELARRSMEPIPSVALLDIHCPQSEVHRQEIEDIADRVRTAFGNTVDLAKQARDVRLLVENEQEGLEPTKSAYFELVGDEKTAKSLVDLGSLENWHSLARRRLGEWRSDFQVPPGPELPGEPQLESNLPVRDYVPLKIIPDPLDQYSKSVCKAADELVVALHSEFEKRSPKVESLRDDIQNRLGSGKHATPELADQVEQFKTRLSELEQQAAKLEGLDKDISDLLCTIDDLIDQASESWNSLRKARKAACKAVNESMPSFLVRLIPDELTAQIDQLLDDLKTGSRLYEASVRETRDALDRKEFVREAVRYVQFPVLEVDQQETNDTSVNARKIAQKAMDRDKYDEIARLAVLWPSDGIEILQKAKCGDLVPFDSLTEGLKALAIKEISFAASKRPAVTDQPEDAVPTTAIFENLVPTIRQQRVFRQFIIASHDANVVVSGDMERVIVLSPEPSNQPIVGTLFDVSIRDNAIALLEGGDRAFEIRQRRYGEYG